MEKEIQKRNILIVKLHKKGRTQQEIADQIGLTRQRVQQIETILGLKRVRVAKPGYKLTCKYSGEVFYSKNKRQCYAKREYYYLSRRKYTTPEARQAYLEKRRAKNRKKASWYYHNVFKKRPDWQDIVRRRNEKYAVSATN